MSSTASGIRVGIDIGGTFTDGVMVAPNGGGVWHAKLLTTPEDPTIGAARVLHDLRRQAGLADGEAVEVIHGTTLVINSIIERTGSRVALVTTAGFEDTIELGREATYDVYDLNAPYPSSIVPADLRFGLEERIAYDGSIVTPLDEAEVRTLAATIGESGAEAIAVSLLHSMKNSTHEIRIREIFREMLPDLPISLSHEIAPVEREYERTLTTAANAYVQPLMSAYLPRLQRRLQGTADEGVLMLMNSSGGVISIQHAVERPIELIESGPAGGVHAALYAGRAHGSDKVIAFDMGGTTAKSSLVDDGRPLVSHELESARERRSSPGSGLTFNIASVDLIEIGSGGGSIARVDDLGVHVGPTSAGSSPGPASYGLGGTRPTVTDAAVVLGYIGSSSISDGSIDIDPNLARNAIEEKIARPMQLSIEQAAFAIHDVVAEQMSSAIATYAAERGRDHRDFVLVPTGGGGPVHAYSVARKLGVRTVLVPKLSGVASAVGILSAPAKAERVRPQAGDIGAVSLEEINDLFDVMRSEVKTELVGLGISESAISWDASVELRYEGQSSTTSVPVNLEDPHAEGIETIVRRFEAVYAQRVGAPMDGLAIETVAWHLVGRGPEHPPVLHQYEAKYGSDSSRKIRKAYFSEAQGYLDAEVIQRGDLTTGTSVRGPVLIEESTSTLVVGPSGTVVVDEAGQIVVSVEG